MGSAEMAKSSLPSYELYFQLAPVQQVLEAVKLQLSALFPSWTCLEAQEHLLHLLDPSSHTFLGVLEDSGVFMVPPGYAKGMLKLLEKEITEWHDMHAHHVASEEGADEQVLSDTFVEVYIEAMAREKAVKDGEEVGYVSYPLLTTGGVDTPADRPAR
jgi:hypothetical protein